MNREQIEKWAREADTYTYGVLGTFSSGVAWRRIRDEHFARLVRDAALEEAMTIERDAALRRETALLAQVNAFYLGTPESRLLAMTHERDEALAARTKQIGVACMTHDLTHALACGHCYAEALETLRELTNAFDGPNDDMLAFERVAFERARAILARIDSDAGRQG